MSMEKTVTPPKKVVLFADDAASVRFLIKSTLESAGYATLQTTDGQEALDVLMSDAHVDILLTDLHMPRIDGLALVQQTRALSARRYLPIVMLTTESQTDRVREGLKAGLTAWMVKPFKGDTLLKVVAKVMGQRAPA
jgi:two-component system, chemotaxis family, chemotaxis protein CheY